MRLYTLNNSYLQGICSGIQTQHSTVRLMRKYEGNPTIERWADHHETTIALNGGDHETLEALYTLMVDCANFPFAFDIFHEPGLNYAATSIAILFEEKDYVAMRDVRSSGDPLRMYDLYSADVAFIMTKIMNMNLAK